MNDTRTPEQLVAEAADAARVARVRMRRLALKRDRQRRFDDALPRLTNADLRAASGR